MAEESIKNILVLIDFSELSNIVIESAAQQALILGIHIEFIHVESNKAKQQEALKRMQTLADAVEKKHNLKPSLIVKEGNIYTAISDHANQTKPVFVFMGTHGMVGMQKIFGSKALKVIVGSSIPFWVLQESTPANITNIVLPIDYTFESKEKLTVVRYLSHFHKFKVNIVHPNLKDSILRNKIKNNMVHVDKLLKEREIEYEIIIGADKGDIADAVVKVAHDINADLIIITTTKHIAWNDYLFGAPEQKIIPNQFKIPVICVNPRTDLTKFASFR